MKHTLIFAALAAAIAAAPAQAQPVAADLLPAYEVATIVASMGMRPVGRPAWMRGRYMVAAIDRYGREVNVVLDARDGQVLAVRPLAPQQLRRASAASGLRRARRPTIRWTAGPCRRTAAEAAPDGPPPDDERIFRQ